MIQYGTWKPFAGNEVLFLTLTLLMIGCVLAYLGARLHHPITVQGPGRTVGIFLVAIWILSLLALGIAVSLYVRALFDQVGNVALPDSPIAPVTFVSGLVAFSLIAFLNRQHGLKIALGSAIVGTIAAPMIFEFPFDLIVMWRTYPPEPARQFTLLYFLPLFIWEISSFALLTWSPLMSLSKYTLFSLSAMFFVFTVWAWFGFPYPFRPIPLALNAGSKILSFVVTISLFLPQKERSKPVLQPSAVHVSHET